MSRKSAAIVGMWLLSAVATMGVASFTNKSFYSTRSQSVDAARELTGWQRLINRDATDCFYGALYVAPVYTRSYNACQISEFLFNGESLVFSGSRYPFRGENDILADYFGLPMDFYGTACLDPVITNFIMDFDFYFGLDSICNGLYFRVFAPVTHAKWDLNTREFMPTGTGVVAYPAGYMGPQQIVRDNLEDTIIDALTGNITFGDKKDPMIYGRIFGRQTVNRVADLRVALGWNYTGAHHHEGINLRVAFPTGNQPTAEFLFDAIAGNGGHWELGVGLTAHYDLWQSAGGVHTVGLYCDANITHLFAVGQKRSFDFIANGPGSRYVLLEDFRSGSNDLFLGAPGVVPAPNQYHQTLVPAINETTLCTKISFDVQADVVLKLAYYYKGFSFDIGYNFWARSKERLHSRQCFESDRFAIKGDAQVYGFNATNSPVALNATQSRATLHGGQGAGNSNFANANADSPINASDSTVLLANLNTADSLALNIPQQTVQTSNPAVLLQDSDLNICGALLPKAITNKMFVYLGNTWNHDGACRWLPFLGLGADVEWKNGGKSNCAYSQWGIWLKGGVGF